MKKNHECRAGITCKETPVQKELSKCCGSDVVFNEGDSCWQCMNCKKLCETTTAPQTSSGERCTKCNNYFDSHQHIHITREGKYHTACYNSLTCYKKLEIPSPSSESWVEQWEKMFYEGDRNSTMCQKHNCYATPHEILSFIKNTITAEVERGRKALINEIKESGELVWLPDEKKPTWHITDEALEKILLNH